MNLRERLSQQIKAHREYRGMSQAELARRLGVHWTTTCRWEQDPSINQSRVPTFDVLEQIAEVLECDPADLLQDPTLTWKEAS